MNLISNLGIFQNCSVSKKQSTREKIHFVFVFINFGRRKVILNIV